MSTITQDPGSAFVAQVTNATPATTIGCAIYDPVTNTYPTIRFTAGIRETPSNSGIYYANLTAPIVEGRYQVVWDEPGPVYTSDDLIVTSSAPPGSPIYITSEQLKATLTMSSTTFADADVDVAIGAASRAIDSTTGRRFWLDPDATRVRYYTPRAYRLLQIDDLVTMTSVQIDRSGTGTFTETWTQGTDYVLEPFNAPSEQPARPYETLRVRLISGRWLPPYIEQSVKITGQFGWAAVPDDVTAATGILAAKLLKRSRDAPFGIAQVGIDGAAMRIAKTDPDVYTLLKDYNRHEFLV